MNNDNKIEMLNESLFTSEGFVNPAGIKELENTVKETLKSHDRLSGKPEWSNRKDKWTFKHTIVGAFAMAACRLSPYGVPDGLENVCKYLNACLDEEFFWNDADMKELSLCDISKALYSILYEQSISEFDSWNKCKKGDTPEIQYVSRFCGRRNPDYDFIDLDALLHYVCIIIRDERRKDVEFDKQFQLKHGNNE